MGEEVKLIIAYIRALASRAYIINKKVLKGRKFLLHTHIEYLTGFNITNIYRIWVPYLKRIFYTRNIHINETIKFDSINPHLNSLIVREVKDLI